VAALDREFIWDIACAVAARLDAFPATRIACRAGPAASATKSAVEALRSELKVLRSSPPPPAVAAAADSGGAAPEGAAEGGAAETEGEPDQGEAKGGAAAEAEAAPGEEEEEVAVAEGDEGTVDHAKKAEKLAKKVLPPALANPAIEHCRAWPHTGRVVATVLHLLAGVLMLLCHCGGRLICG
jgi:hypothetical protein